MRVCESTPYWPIGKRALKRTDYKHTGAVLRPFFRIFDRAVGCFRRRYRFPGTLMVMYAGLCIGIASQTDRERAFVEQVQFHSPSAPSIFTEFSPKHLGSHVVESISTKSQKFSRFRRAAGVVRGTHPASLYGRLESQNWRIVSTFSCKSSPSVGSQNQSLGYT